MNTAELEQHTAKMNKLRAEWSETFRPQRETLQRQGKSPKEIAMTEHAAWAQWISSHPCTQHHTTLRRSTQQLATPPKHNHKITK